MAENKTSLLSRTDFKTGKIKPGSKLHKQFCKDQAEARKHIALLRRPYRSGTLGIQQITI